MSKRQIRILKPWQLDSTKTIFNYESNNRKYRKNLNMAKLFGKPLTDEYETPYFHEVVEELAAPLWNAGYFRGGEVGARQEKERIIKLLEEIITERKKTEQTDWVQNEISNLHYLIELIKGETNG